MLKFIIRYFQRNKNNLPKYLHNVWWNRSVHDMDNKYPIVNLEDIGYLDCEIGLIVPMKDLKGGRYAYYEVKKINYKKGSDWLYPSDSIECNMKFYSIRRRNIGIGKRNKNNKTVFTEHFSC